MINPNADCDIDNIFIKYIFGEHFENIEIDFGDDNSIEWKFSDEAYGKYGLQDMFYFGEQNG